MHLHFIPTSSSWLNVVEGSFSELTPRQLNRLAVNCVGALIETITAYIAQRNRQPKPIAWTASVYSIVSKVRKADQA